MSSGRVARAAARVTHVSRGHGSTSAPSYRRCEGGSRKEGGCRKLQEGCRKVLSRRKARGEASGRGAEAGVAAGSGARRGWSRSGRRAARRSAREARCPGCPARTVSARQRGWTACVGRGGWRASVDWRCRSSSAWNHCFTPPTEPSAKQAESSERPFGRLGSGAASIWAFSPFCFASPPACRR